MEVTRQNFYTLLPKLEEEILNCEFLAIDGEFTGINFGPPVGAFDTPKQYYEKLRRGEMDFLLVQFGLCIFTYDKKKERYFHNDYNFYVFPQQFDRNAPNTRFLCQSSSVNFLASLNFDFNKLFKDGIPYLTLDDEKRLKDALEEKHNLLSQQNDIIPIPNEHKKTVDDYCSQVEKFLKNEEPEQLEFERCNNLVRKLLYQEIFQRFGYSAFVETKKTEDFNMVLVITRSNEKERKAKEKERKQKEFKEIDDAVGFSKLIRLITKSEKLVIGHNMLLDLFHVVHQFCTPLPQDYDMFKLCVFKYFPNVLDTKYMGSDIVLKDFVNSTVLNHLIKTLSEKPFHMPEVDPGTNETSYSLGDEKSHEAGYDAFITGLCFIGMTEFLSSVKRGEKQILASASVLDDFRNRLFLMRLQDNVHINLQGKDPNPPRDHVFYITFPKAWRTSDIIQLFSPVGTVFVSFCNDASAYVAVNNRENAKKVMKEIEKSDLYTIVPYQMHQSQENQKTKTCSCEAKLPAQDRIYKLTSPSDSLKKRKLKDTSGEQSMSQQAAKKQRRISYSKRSIDTIPEEDGEENQCESSKSSNNVGSKLFEENSSWD